MNFQFLVSVQNTLSSLSLCTLILSKHKRNLSALPVSLSLRGLEKDGDEDEYSRYISRKGISISSN